MLIPEGLKTFRALAEAASFTTAARALNITQSAVSKRIQQLEDHLGVPLVDRSSRGVKLTEYGELLRAFAEEMTLSVADFRQRFSRLQAGQSGHLRIGLGYGWQITEFQKALFAFRLSAPNVTVHLCVGDHKALLPALRRGEIELALTMIKPPAKEEDVSSALMMEAEIEVICRKDHPLARRTRIDIHDLIKQDWVLPSYRFELRYHFERLFRDSGLEPPIPSITVDGPSVSFMLIRDSNMLGIANTALLRAVDAADVMPLALKSGKVAQSFAVSFLHGSNLPPVASRFLEELARACGRRPIDLARPDRIR